MKFMNAIRSTYITIIIIILSAIFCFAQSAKPIIDVPQSDDLILLQPVSRSLVHTVTPYFKWKPIDQDNVEYRLRIAEWNGKTVFDEWVGKNTSITVQTVGLFQDLTVYLWNVFASRGDQSWQSETYSFCVDLNTSVDLEVLQLHIVNREENYTPGHLIRIDVDVLNCGPVPCMDVTLRLSNGNPNTNYRFADAPTIWQDSVSIDQLIPNETNRFTVQGVLHDGLNKFYAQLKTRREFSDLYQANNVKIGPTIQTYKRPITLNGLFIIFPELQWQLTQKFVLKNEVREQIRHNIHELQSFLWEHTQLLSLQIDTLSLSQTLRDNDFELFDENSGYLLSPDRLEKCLDADNIVRKNYDFLFVYYPWSNSVKHWIGYHGYVFPTSKRSSENYPIAVQPVVPQNSIDLQVTIHEFMHIIESLFPETQSYQWPSPDQREAITTFTNELDYYAWILETWPSVRWYDLKTNSDATETPHYDGANATARDFYLMQNFPNPFNSSTAIRYRVPQQLNVETVTVSLKVYSVIGECVKTLVNESQTRGEYLVVWDGKTDENQVLPSGMYFYKLSLGQNHHVRKLLLLK
jgi:hypothetical protein